MKVITELKNLIRRYFDEKRTNASNEIESVANDSYEENIKQFIEMVANGEDIIVAANKTGISNMNINDLIVEICNIAWQSSCDCN